jgi:GntR family transcriptional regulator
LGAIVWVLLDPDSPIPLYHQLAEALYGQIRAGTYAPGDRVPSEHELAATYRVGRPTVRQATDTLIQRGVVERRRGSGTFVRRVPAQVDLFSLGGTLASFEAKAISVDARLVGRTETLSVNEAGHPLLNREAVRVVRLSSIDGEPVLLERIDFDAERFPGLNRLPLRGRALSQVIEAEYRLRPVAADQSFAVDHAGKRDSALLGVGPRAPLLRVDRTLHFAGMPAAIYARMLCRPGRFVFAQRIGGSPHA